MAAVAQRLIGPGDGTPESDWRDWLSQQPLPESTAAQLVASGQRAVVVAPHPDDEVLAAGGLLAQLARLGRKACVIAVTDGGASHPGSTVWSAERLARQRPVETARALAALGVEAPVVRLQLRDGELAGSIGRLAGLLQSLLTPDDVLFTTWRLDGHPDHEATGRACAQAAMATGAQLVEVPVWAWHWAAPGDLRLPWSSACLVPLDPGIVERKCAALQAFRSQLGFDPSTGQPPVLRDSIRERAARPFELMFR